MPDEGSKVRRYASKYGRTEYTTAENFFAEMMSERKAQREGKSLPRGFWRIPAWGEFYRLQVVAAHRLFRKFDPYRTGAIERALYDVLRGKEGRRVYSLNAPFLLPLLERAVKEVLAKRAIARDTP